MSAIEHVLNENECGTVVAIVPGGAAEALYSFPDSFRLLLKHHKGFIKLALKHGYIIFNTSSFILSRFRASLVPMYTFGETNTFNQVSNPEGSLIRRFQVCIY
jgi:hypothetical protein